MALKALGEMSELSLIELFDESTSAAFWSV